METDDLVTRVEYTLRGSKMIINASTPDWESLWLETRRKWEGRCFTFNPSPDMSSSGLSNIEIISKFPHDLIISYHARNQTMDEDLTGVSFIAHQNQFYKLKVPVDIIWNRNTESKPCTPEDLSFDDLRNGIAVTNMMELVGCIVPFIKNDEEKYPICESPSEATIAEEIFEGRGPYYDFYNSDKIPLPCKQMHADPVKVFAEPEWDGQTWVNAKFTRHSQ